MQAGLALLIMGLFALMPPTHGTILIVSLSGQGRGEITRWAIAQGAQPLGFGPWSNSLVVTGNRTALLAGALSEHALLLTGTAAGCSEKAPA